MCLSTGGGHQQLLGEFEKDYFRFSPLTCFGIVAYLDAEILCFKTPFRKEVQKMLSRKYPSHLKNPFNDGQEWYLEAMMTVKKD